MSLSSALPHTSALLVVDVQRAFDNPRWGQRNNPEAEQTIAGILDAFRTRQLPVIHINHCNPAPGSLFNPDGPGFPVKPEVQPLPGEPILYKNVNSSFIGTHLEARLRSQGIDTLVIIGLTTDHCCSTTARMAANLNFTTYFISDATATFERTGPSGKHYTAEEMHDTAITSLSGEFATILTAEELLQRFPSALFTAEGTAPR